MTAEPVLINEDDNIVKASLQMLQSRISTYERDPVLSAKQFGSKITRKNQPSFLKRFLRISKYGAVDTTLLRLVKYQEWYDEHLNTRLHASRFKDILRTGFLMRIPGHDNSGRVGFLVRPRLLSLTPETLDESFLAIMYFVEKTLEIEGDALSLYGAIVIIDCAEMGWDNFDASFARRLLHGFQDRYPIRLGAMILVRQPAIVTAIWSVLSSFLKPKLRQRVHFAGNDFEKLFVEFGFKPDQIARELGGQLELSAEVQYSQLAVQEAESVTLFYYIAESDALKLGISVDPEDDFCVLSVEDGSVGAKLGIQAGDSIRYFNERLVSDVSDLKIPENAEELTVVVHRAAFDCYGKRLRSSAASVESTPAAGKKNLSLSSHEQEFTLKKAPSESKYASKSKLMSSASDASASESSPYHSPIMDVSTFSFADVSNEVDKELAALNISISVDPSIVDSTDVLAEAEEISKELRLSFFF